MCNLLSRIIPCGIYYCIQKWFKKRCLVPLKTFFDNSKVLCRKWKDKYQCKSNVSGITLVSYIWPCDTSFLQFHDKLSQKQWVFGSQLSDIYPFIKVQCDQFQAHRNNFTSQLLNDIWLENSSSTTLNSHRYLIPAKVGWWPFMLISCSYQVVDSIFQQLLKLLVMNHSVNRQWLDATVYRIWYVQSLLMKIQIYRTSFSLLVWDI